jgi:cellulose synthase/poly-beta-1,6-N-acetylglucosamine synthase-like glycosyltransferase
MPPVSIIITAHEQCDVLRRHLPAFLEQDYPADYEVIVVDMNSTDDTLPMLENLQRRNPNLHIVCLPDSARDVSPLRLALTLGIRSASNEWLVLSKADCIPASSHWLSHMISTCEARPETQIVLGQSRFVDGHGWHGLRCRFFRARQQWLHLYYAKRNGAYRCDGTNLCYRRSLFFEHRGFADHANLLAGATDIMVNHHSTARNTAVCTDPEAIILQDTPRNPDWWSRERLFFMETRQHMAHGLPYRLRYATALMAQLLWPIAAIALIAICWPNPYVLVPVGLMWTALIAVRQWQFFLTTRALGIRPFHASLPLFLHLPLVWDLGAWLRWRMSDKKNYRKRFV